MRVKNYFIKSISFLLCEDSTTVGCDREKNLLNNGGLRSPLIDSVVKFGLQHEEKKVCLLGTEPVTRCTM